MVGTYLRVSNNDKLSTRALSGKVVDRSGDSLDTSASRSSVVVTALGWVVDGLGCGTWVGIEDKVDYGAGRTVACWSGGLTGAENVDVWARGTLDWDGESAGGCQKGESGGLGEHVDDCRCRELFQ